MEHLDETPLPLVTRECWELLIREARAKEIWEAMHRYAMARKPVPVEWLEEFLKVWGEIREHEWNHR